LGFISGLQNTKNTNVSLKTSTKHLSMANFFDNQNLIEIIWKWKKHLIIVGILAIVFSSIFSSSLFIKPKFKSTARIYPSFNIYTYSDESESEQLLEISNSLDIKLKVIDAFNLADVYRIKKQDPLYRTYMLSEFNDNVSFKKTEYETVEISVLDTDPQRACAMCDSIISFVNDRINTLHRVKFEEVARSSGIGLKKINHEIDSLEEKLDFLRKTYKLLDYESQSEQITKGMVKVLAEGKKNTAGGKELEQWMKDLQEKGGEYNLLAKAQKNCISERDSIKTAYDRSLSNVKNNLVYGHLVQSPLPADKKSYPIRWLIVLVSTFAALFVALLVVLVLENQKKA
jgi:capsular polysaccharide biosynthesis protein